MRHTKFMLIAIIAVLVVMLPGVVNAQSDGGTVKVGIFVAQAELQLMADGFVAGMTDLGYVDGENVTYVYNTPSDDPEETLAQAQALIDAGVDVLLGAGEAEAVMLKKLTSEVPIVVATSPDPVRAGLVESFEKPGGNVTGIEMTGYHQRRLQLLVEMDPSIKTVYFPLNTMDPAQQALLEAVQEKAKALGVEIYVGEYNDIESALEAIASIPDNIDAIFVSLDRLLYTPQVMGAWIQASMRFQAGTSIPVYTSIPGVLMGYGPDPFACGKQAAGIVDRILRGADTRDLPVESAEYFLNVNLDTATAIGLDIPRGILRQADSITRPGDLDAEE